MYTYHRGLVRHMTYECGVDSKFKCDKCGRPFKRKENMKSHMINIHKSSFKNIDLKYCDFRTPTVFQQ